MFGIGFPELLLLLIIAFVVVGPEKLPHIARALGKGLFQIRRATEEVREEMEKEWSPAKDELDRLMKEEKDHLKKEEKKGEETGR